MQALRTVEITPEQEHASEARLSKIHERWASGARCTVPELREIRSMVGEPAFRRSMEALLGVSVEESASCSGGTSLPKIFVLGRAAYQKDLCEYEEIFSTKVRQLKRYIRRGREAEPPELPPLDDPMKMADWWAKHYPRRRIPRKFLELKLPSASGVAGNTRSETQPPAVTMAPLDLQQLSLQQGASVEMAQRYLAAAHLQLLKGYEAGDDAIIRLWQPRFYEALDALRKAEASERQAAKIRGDLVAKSQIFSDIAELLEIQRTMKETAGKRILAGLGELLPELADKIERAIMDELERQNSVLRQLPGFKSKKDLELELMT